jgi:hypothetical protein
VARFRRQRFDITDEELFWEPDADSRHEELPDDPPAPHSPLELDARHFGHARVFAVLALVGAVGLALMVSDGLQLIIGQVTGGPDDKPEAQERSAKAPSVERPRREPSVLASLAPRERDPARPAAKHTSRSRYDQPARRERQRGPRSEPAAPVRTSAPQAPAPAAPAPSPTPAPSPSQVHAAAPPSDEFGFEE